ncbi:MAG: hypothetical protein LBH82_07000 [Bacteroidales bacterium]|nr:hypothetical protein [Bacteroidales bacterium]
MICKRLCKWVVGQTVFLFCCFSIGNAQNNATDTAKTPAVSSFVSDSSLLKTDSLAAVSTDSIVADSSKKYLPVSKNAVTSVVDYFAQDSVCFNMDSATVYLYHNTDLHYDDVNLKANYVEINFSTNELFSKGIPDTLDKLQGTPVFQQGSYEVKSHELTYNFDSKKGLLRNVITQEGESYLHGEIVKKNEDNTSFIRRGKYTTCNLEHPHFEIDFGKAKVIPNDKVITGPLYLRIANIPTFLAFPFGFFPNSDKHTNGLLMPKYGQHNDLGPYLEGVGYYFALKEKIDFAITANIYLRGAFGAGLKSNYIKRYKFNGSYDIQYAYTPSGERTTAQFLQQHDFRIYWRHQQDPKAHPVNRFSANVDFKTSSFSENTVERNLADYTKSKALSTVNFSTVFKSRYSLGVNAELSQDLVEGNLDMKLPQVNFGVSQFYPFRRKQATGKLRWYENISMQYTVDMQNLINTYDSVLVKDFKRAFEDYRMGMNHNLPIKSTVKILKHISWTNSVTWVESWQINRGVRQQWDGYDIRSLEDTATGIITHDTLGSIIRKDTSIGFHQAHNLTISTGLSTTLYGMYTFKKGKVSAFRHTITPSVSFNYRPGINRHLYKTYYDPYFGEDIQYTTIAGSLYATPDFKSSGKIVFSISNRLEMKIRQKKDGEETFKKVTLLDNVTLSSGYDLLRDSLRWDMLTLSGRTTLFKYFNISFNFHFDPYIIDSNRRVNRYEIKEMKRLFRFSSTAWNISTGINLNREFFRGKNADAKQEQKDSPSGFGDWNLSLSYIFDYNMEDNYDYYRYRRIDTLIPAHTHRFRNSLTVNANFAITSKWDLNITTGYNFEDKQITPSEFYVERDLHCWIISFKWRPFGYTRGFEFGIRAKANILSDVKYNHRKDLYE